MIRSDLLETIANGENSGVEFKRDDLRPEQLAREAVELANFQGRHILLDRLEVLSPGALQNTMTMEKMIAGQRSPRNPMIVDVLRDYGSVDARRMGVRNKIIPLLRERNGTEPEFEATEGYLGVVMHRGPQPVGGRN